MLDEIEGFDMNPDVFELTLEQELQLARIRFACGEASREQLAEMLLQLSTQMAIKDNIIRDLVRKI